MELSKHKAHRNSKYLAWLRERNCVVSHQKAECAHHIRLGTNGGTGIKPSDYFCLPLLNEFHTTGPMALHVIGEETFLEHFGLEAKQLFIKFLKEYLAETFEIHYMLEGRRKPEEAIAELIGLIENKLPKLERPKKKTKGSSQNAPQKSIKNDEFYQKAKELKREKDKELRAKLKEQKREHTPKATFKGNEAYERAKELKRQRDKELRAKLKERSSKKTSPTLKGNEFYEKAKELKRQRDKELRRKLKAKQKLEQTNSRV